MIDRVQVLSRTDFQMRGAYPCNKTASDMDVLDPETYDERLARLGRRKETRAAWTVMGIALVLILGFTLLMEDSGGGGGNGSDRCPQRIHVPGRGTPDSSRPSDWTERPDRLDWEALDESADYRRLPGTCP